MHILVLALHKCTRQIALERQDVSCTYLARHELESAEISRITVELYQTLLQHTLFGPL